MLGAAGWVRRGRGPAGQYCGLRGDGVALRQIVRIEDALCNGCGECVTPCVEGAIAMVNGKAKVLRHRVRSYFQKGSKGEKTELMVRAIADLETKAQAGVPAPEGSVGDALQVERREGRIIFLVLVVALAAAVMWLMTRFHF